jgi:hypothetical protein
VDPLRLTHSAWVDTVSDQLPSVVAFSPGTFERHVRISAETDPFFDADQLSFSFSSRGFLNSKNILESPKRGAAWFYQEVQPFLVIPLLWLPSGFGIAQGRFDGDIGKHLGYVS